MAETANKFIVKYRENYYNIKDFLHKHPGGANTLKGLQNADMTARFMKAPPHSDAAMYLMKEYKIPNNETISKYKLLQLKENLEIVEQFEYDNNNNNKSNNNKDNSSENNSDKSIGVIFDESMEHLVDWSKAMVPQIPKIAQCYGEWVHKPVDRPLKLFAPWLLEICTKTPWWLIPLFWLPIIFKLLHDEFTIKFREQEKYKLIFLTLYFLTGIITWTLIEYILHRFVFHMRFKTSTHPWLCTFHFLIHGLHHKVPFDSQRLVFPPLGGVVIASILYTPVALILPQPRLLLAGALFGYLCYDMIHYYLHYGSPDIGHLYHMKRYHYQHHFAHQDLGYGISTTLWDRIFNTRIQLRKLRFHLKW